MDAKRGLSVLEDSIILEVLCKPTEQSYIPNFIRLFLDPPKVLLKYGSSLNERNIVEGSDVYFDCIIDSNPSVYKVEWFKNVGNHRES